MAKTEQITQAKTFIEAVKESLTAASGYNSGDAVAPAAILWADADGEWRPIVEKLRPLMPELLVLGAFAPEERTGPAIWMRCVIEGTLPEVKLPEKAVPVLYLPNVGRQQLRSPEDCPDALKPLVELQYRGTVWTQTNSKDWTVEAFLVSENGGLGLDVSRDSKTRAAMLGALDALATVPIAALRGRKLEAEDFDKLMVGDTVRDLLAWVNDPASCKEEWDPARWAAFKSRCREEYGFDPETDGELVAAERLGSKQGPWAKVWNRVAESPALYMGLPAVLRKAKPRTLLFDREPWPDENEKDEVNLGKELAGLNKLKPAEARDALVQLDKKHAERRKWVWARMGLCPLALALEHLKTLAENTGTALAGNSPDAIGSVYTKTGYRADDAVLRALAAVKTAEDQEAVRTAIRAVYLPWLEDTARNFQAAAVKEPLPNNASLKERLVAAELNECLLFVDGLRYDVAQRLLARSHERQLESTEAYRWAALPTVTATAKPAVSPVATDIVGEQAGADFCPVFSDGRKPVNAERLREAAATRGYQVLQGLDAGQPHLENSRAWSECGEFDTLGHKLQSKLAGQIDEQLDLLLDRILHLLSAGWRTVRVVTDHGWLLMPGGLPVVPLKKYLAECRWSRCAVINEGAHADVPTAGWFWDGTQSVAYAPGAYCFLVGTEYAHGGLSLQECLIPDLVFSSPAQSKELQVTIESVQWVGLRCRVVIKPTAEGLSAGLRLRPNDASSSICAPKLFDNEGRAGLLVEDESLLGSAAILVVFDAAGRILCKQPTIVGGNT
jgi:hypothetical protein